MFFEEFFAFFVVFWKFCKEISINWIPICIDILGFFSILKGTIVCIDVFCISCDVLPFLNVVGKVSLGRGSL